ncbi:hypothetical protein, partial [Ketobacter sp.]
MLFEKAKGNNVAATEDLFIRVTAPCVSITNLEFVKLQSKTTTKWSAERSEFTGCKKSRAMLRTFIQEKKKPANAGFRFMLSVFYSVRPWVVPFPSPRIQ